MKGEAESHGCLVRQLITSNRHRKLRKALRDGLHGKAIEAYWPNEELEARLFMEGLKRDPTEFITHLKRYFHFTSSSLLDTPLIPFFRFAASVVLTTTYDHKVQSFSKDPYVPRLFQSASEFARTLSPGRHLVDFLPFLKGIPSWVPGTGWQKAAAEHEAKDRGLYFEIFNDVKQLVVRGFCSVCKKNYSTVDFRTKVKPDIVSCLRCWEMQATV